MIHRIMMVLMSLMLLASTAKAEDDKIDTTGHGAVLCAYVMNVQILAIGNRCFPGSDPKMKAALAQSVTEIEDFIVANSDTTRTDLSKSRKAYSDEIGRPGLSCGDVGSLYQMTKHFTEQKGLDALRSQTKKLLAVPRKPKMNPCL